MDTDCPVGREEYMVYFVVKSNKENNRKKENIYHDVAHNIIYTAENRLSVNN